MGPRVHRRVRHAWPLVLLACGCGDDGIGTIPSDVGRIGDGRLAAALESIREARGIPALGALVLQDGRILESAVTGIRATGFPELVASDDAWHLGSLTKSMTATVAARLVEEGVVTWEVTVGDVFGRSIPREDYVEVRLDELLYHVSGLPNEVVAVPAWSTVVGGSLPLTDQRRAWAEDLLQMAPAAARGDHLYSNAGYVVAGAMLEAESGRSWEDLIESELFEPLDMQSAGFGAPGSRRPPDQPWGHVLEGSTWVAFDPADPAADNPAALGPAGTAHAPMETYARYMIEHLAGASGSDGLLAASTYAKLHGPAPGTAYALGWGVATREWGRGRVLQHAGSNGRWYAVVWLAPERALGLFSVANAGGDRAATATDEAVQALIRRLDGSL
jgi:D-alanyl-D-alanine carboxypeptidase